MKHIAIIGGGITGVTSAYTLAQAGYRVTLIEKNRYAGMETSYANGGQLSASNAEVWTHPSTIVKGLKWMFTKDAPALDEPHAHLAQAELDGRVCGRHTPLPRQHHRHHAPGHCRARAPVWLGRDRRH